MRKKKQNTTKQQKFNNVPIITWDIRIQEQKKKKKQREERDKKNARLGNYANTKLTYVKIVQNLTIFKNCDLGKSDFESENIIEYVDY